MKGVLGGARRRAEQEDDEGDVREAIRRRDGGEGAPVDPGSVLPTRARHGNALRSTVIVLAGSLKAA